MGISHKAVKGLGNQSNRVLGDIQNINRDKENTIKKIVPQKRHSVDENESDFQINLNCLASLLMMTMLNS